MRDHDNELATRYINHDIIESYKGMLQVNKHQAKLNVGKFSQEKIDELKIEYDSLVKQYGKSYKSQYGWAADVLSKSHPRFSDIEEYVGLDHMRPYYKWASQNVHPNIKGLTNKLGLSEATEDILLVGPSNSGMTDPAESTALSIAQSTVFVLNTEPNVDDAIAIKIIDKMARRIGNIFHDIEKSKPE